MDILPVRKGICSPIPIKKMLIGFVIVVVIVIVAAVIATQVLDEDEGRGDPRIS